MYPTCLLVGPSFVILWTVHQLVQWIVAIYERVHLCSQGFPVSRISLWHSYIATIHWTNRRTVRHRWWPNNRQVRYIRNTPWNRFDFFYTYQWTQVFLHLSMNTVFGPSSVTHGPSIGLVCYMEWTSSPLKIFHELIILTDAQLKSLTTRMNPFIMSGCICVIRYLCCAS